MGRRCRRLIPIGLLFAVVCRGQVPDTAELRGRIMDETRAVVTGASLTLSNQETGFRYSQTSSTKGDFVFQILPTGSYTLTAELPQFETLKIGNIRLTLNQHLDLGALTLKVGSSSSHVEVVAETNPIDTSSAALRSVFTEKQMQDLPVLATGIRSIQNSLLELTPGASNSNTQSDGTGQTFRKMSINGSPIGGVGFSLNGIDNTNLSWYFGGPLSGGPNQDAVSEFSIQTATFKAESGNMAAQVSVETKGGGNDFHMQARGIYLDPTLSAQDFFRVTPPGQQVYRREVGGIQFSGPVWLPGIYSGRNKTFFFFDTEYSRSRSPFTYRDSVFSDAERAGDFSGLPASQWPIDPLTGKVFQDGRIPAYRVVPQSRRFIDELMHPATSGVTVTVPWVDHVPTDQATARIDHRFSERDTLQLNAYLDKSLEQDPIVSMQDRNYLYRGWSGSMSARHTHVFSPRSVNSLAFGSAYSRFDGEYGGKLSGTLRDTGFNITSNVNWGYPSFTFVDTYRYSSTGLHYVNPTRLWTVKDDFGFIRGAHSFKMGVAIRAERDRSFGSPNIEFQFSANNPNGTGNEVADFLLGLPASYSQSADSNLFPRRFFSAFYFQDDLKLRSNLTLNLGLRYEIAGAWSEDSGHRAVFRPGAQSSVFVNAPSGMLFPGDTDPITRQTLGTAVSPTDTNNWGPRIGIAYSPSVTGGFWRSLTGGSGRTSIRAGYGVYYLGSPLDVIYKATSVPPWTFSATMDASQLQRSGGTFLNPWGANVDPFTLPINQRLVARPVGGIWYVEPQAREPYQQQWSLSISRQLPAHVGVSINYVGNTVVHIYRKHQANPGVLTSNATVSNVDSRRLYSDFGAIWALSGDGRSNYNALQIDVNRRFTSAFQFNASYVWSKAMDNAGTNNINQQTLVADRDVTPWARSNYDRRHQLVFTGVWDLPKSPIHSLRTVLSGWKLSSIVQMRSGLPLNLRNLFDTTMRGDDPNTADIVGPFRRIDPREVHTFTLPNGQTVTGHFFFDPTAFVRFNPSSPQQARPGTLGRNPFTGLGRSNVDVSLSKTFTVAERHHIQVRMDATNVFNHAQFIQSNTGVTLVQSPFFGQTNHTAGPRLMQFVVKYNF
jgi:hypothetical protein